MAADVITSKMESSLRITRVGPTPEKLAKEGEDIAILSTFLPPSLQEHPAKPFHCALNADCKHNDPKLATPGTLHLQIRLLNSSLIIKICRK
jgi:hypothetical protein